MTDFKIGDAVVGINSRAIYVVTGLRENFKSSVRVIDKVGRYLWLSPAVLNHLMAPDWIVQWRIENMPHDTEEKNDE